MVFGFLILLSCQLLGELIVTSFDVPIPGSVVGMVLLLVALMIVKRVPESLRGASEGLLKVLPLLLVPAGVGLMEHFAVLSQYWAQLLITLFISTLVTMFVVAGVLKIMSKEKKTGGHE